MSAAASLFGSSWLSIVAVLSVFGDAFMPLIPDGTAVIAATMGSHTSPLILGMCVALASFSADVALLKVSRRAAGWAQHRLSRSRGAATAAAHVLEALETKRVRTILLFRFVSGGRSLLDLTVGTSTRPPRHYLRWSAVSSTVWATYIVGLGYLNAHTFKTGLLSFAVSCLAATVVSVVIARMVQRQRRATREAQLAREAAALAEATEAAGPNGVVVASLEQGTSVVVTASVPAPAGPPTLETGTGPDTTPDLEGATLAG